MAGLSPYAVEQTPGVACARASATTGGKQLVIPGGERASGRSTPFRRP